MRQALRIRHSASIAACAVALAACAHGVGQHGGPPRIAHIGQQAPDWTQPLAGGGRLTFTSLHGSPVYLNFFASWCEPCNEEAPAINALQEHYARRGLRTVAIDEEENAATALAFKRKYGLIYPAVVDDGALQDQYRINGLPVHVFIDRSGIVRNIVVGQMAKSEIDEAIRKIL